MRIRSPAAPFSTPVWLLAALLGGAPAGSAGAASAAAFGPSVPFAATERRGDDGSLPVRSQPGSARSEEILEAEIEGELWRQRALEDEIEAELRRQEELLEQIRREEKLARSGAAAAGGAEPRASVDPLAAPRAPAEQDLPESIFERELHRVGEQELLVKLLDADRDGNPEIRIEHDARSGALLARLEDTDYDGRFDTVNAYHGSGGIASREQDTNHDGMPDRWTEYGADGRATRVVVDRDFDGVRDGLFRYANGWLTDEEHDTNNDGSIDRRVEYEGRRRAIELEDRDFSGGMEIRTFYDLSGFPERAEIDANEDGRSDVWEYYEGDDPARPVLARKEEDLNGDGDVEVTSYYREGRLVRQEITDTDLVY